MDDAMSKGWFTRKPGTVKVLWGLLGILVLGGGSRSRSCWRHRRTRALLGVPVIVAGILLLIAARWMPKRTAKGYAVLRHTLGFKRFIDESEKHRARVRRAREHLLRVPAVRGRVRRDGEVGQGVRRSRATSRPTRRRGTCRSTRSTTRCSRARSTGSRHERGHAHVVALRRAVRAGSAAVASPAVAVEVAAAGPGSGSCGS